MSEESPLAFKRWPKAAWPLLAAARDLPWLLLIVAGIWAVVALARLAGLSYFKAVPPEEIGVYRVFAFGLLALSFGLVRTVKRMRRPIPFTSRWQPVLAKTLLAPFELVIWTLVSAIRLLPVGLGILALSFPGVLLGGWPDQPPVNFIPLSIAVLAWVAAGALAVGVRGVWSVTHADRKALGPLARACGWLAAAVAFGGLALDLSLGEIERARGAGTIAERLRSRYVPTRIAAANELKAASGDLARAALSDPNRQVRSQAARALRDNPAALPALIEAAARPREYMFGSERIGQFRWEIQATLETMEPKALLPYLDHPSAGVREIVLDCLGTRDAVKLVPAEKALRSMESADKDESRQALWLLYTICRTRPNDVVPLLLERAPASTGERRKEYAHLFRECGPPAAPAIDLLLGWYLGAEERDLWAYRDGLIAIGAAAYGPVQDARRANRDAALQRLDALLAELPRPAPPPNPYTPGLPAEERPKPQPLAEAPAGIPVRVRLTYDSKDFAEDGTADVQVWDDFKWKWFKAEPVEPPSTYEAASISPGRGKAHVNVKVGETSYTGYVEKAIGAGKPALLEVELKRRFRLLEPEAPGPILQKTNSFSPPIRFFWESLGEGVDYELTIRGTTLHSYRTWKTSVPTFEFDGDPGVHELWINAFRGKKLIGSTSYATPRRTGPQGKQYVINEASGYRFTVMPAEATPSTLEFKFRHAGSALPNFGMARFSGSLFDVYRNRATGLPVTEVSGGARIENVLPGAYELRVCIDADRSNPPGFPGDYLGRVTFGVRPDKKPERSVYLLRVMRLLKPEDSSRNILFYASKSGPPVLRGPVDVEWEPLGDDVEYELYVSGNRQIRTREPRVRLDLAPQNQSYNFTLRAYRKGMLFADLVLGGDVQRGSQYHFLVRNRN